MAIKQIYVAECDICGDMDDAKTTSGGYNEIEYTYPDGWISGKTSSVIICPRCRAKLGL